MLHLPSVVITDPKYLNLFTCCSAVPLIFMLQADGHFFVVVDIITVSIFLTFRLSMCKKTKGNFPPDMGSGKNG